MFLQLLQKYQDKFRFKIAFIGKGEEVTIVVTPINKDDEDDSIPAFTAHGTLAEVEMALVEQFDDAMKGLRSAYASADEIRNKAKEVIADAEKKPAAGSKKGTGGKPKAKTEDEDDGEEDTAEDKTEKVEKVKEPAWTAAEKKTIKEIDEIVKKATEKKSDEMMVNFYRKAALDKAATITTSPYGPIIEAKFAAISTAPVVTEPVQPAVIQTPAPAATPAATTPVTNPAGGMFSDKDLF